MMAACNPVPQILGEGTFGVVSLEMIDGKPYAVKKLKRGLNLDEEALQKEIKVLKTCPNHPNIVELINAWKTQDDEINIQMEYCDLGTLNDYMIVNRPNKGTVNSFMLDMAQGIHHLHRNNIVHRDIKPDNILLAARPGNVPICKIADFGFARFTFSTSGNTATMSSTYYLNTGFGTPLFMAPEVDSGHYTKACDIFSLGMVFYAIHSLQTRKDGSKTFLFPVTRLERLFKDAPQEEINSAVTTHVTNIEKANLLMSMLALAPQCRPGANSVGSLISAQYERW
ncbi:serine/threonine-protein kinase pdik1l-B-like [Haliotis cracherodii]|uniref:serine/threonine-protein kinase pdik1l-B-like n=1 Tax=Haliotis cracherodii TaxID=6455 RepID=UPI0039EB5889